NRRHRLLDPRGPRCRLLRAAEVKQVSPLPTWRQRLERALEPRIDAELLLQLLGHGKLWGLRLDLHSGLLGRHGLAYVGLDGGRLRRNLLGAGELHHPRCLDLPELHQQLLRVLQQRTLKEAQRAIFFEALNDDDVFSIHCVAGLSPLALLSQVKPRQDPLQLRNLGPPPLSIRHLHAASPLLQVAEVRRPPRSVLNACAFAMSKSQAASSLNAHPWRNTNAG